MMFVWLVTYAGSSHVFLRFAVIAERLLSRCRHLIWKAAEDASLRMHDVEVVLAIGGSCRMPLLLQTLKGVTGKEHAKCTFAPETAVAIGAMMLAQSLTSRAQTASHVKVVETVCHPLGVSVTDTDGTKDVFSVIVRPNQRLPCSESEQYQTRHDNQEEIVIQLYEGSETSTTIHSCNLLGSVRIMQVPNGVAGSVKVTVSIHINELGFIHFEAKVIMGTTQKQKCTVWAVNSFGCCISVPTQQKKCGRIPTSLNNSLCCCKSEESVRLHHAIWTGHIRVLFPQCICPSPP